MPCITPASENTYVEYLEDLLCKACKKLFVREIKEIQGITNDRIGLLEWYLSHLAQDVRKDEKTKAKALSEFNRLGIEVEITEGSVSYKI